jgi:signal peptidase I
MKSETVSDKAAEIYQAAAREVWHADRSAELLRLKVTGESMRPLLCAGDVVVVQPIDLPTLRPGEVVVVQRGGEWITHRLVTIDERGWHTHGDNTRYTDEAAHADQLVGRVIAIERADQTIDLQQSHWRAIDRRINRVQRVQLRALAAARTVSGTQSTRLTRRLAALINWPFQVLVRVLLWL